MCLLARAVAWLSLCALSLLNVPFVFGAPYPDTVSAHKRSLSSWVSVGSGGNWPCSVEQIGEIETAVEYTKILANAAIVALNDAGTSSAAFARWFGGGFQDIDSTDTHSEDNAQVSTGETIKTNHYDAVISQLRAPESGTVKWVDEGGLDLNRLVYACPTADDGLCASGEAAAVINAGDVGFKVNFLYLCPSFFNRASNSRMLLDWRSNRYSPSSGLVLLHEMQHLNAVVGADRRSGDLSYSVSGCMRLEPQDKIKNAQNFAFFALDVMANPPSKSGI